MKQWLWDHLRNLMGLWFAAVQAKAAGIFSRVLISLGLGWVAVGMALPKIKAELAPYFSAVAPQYQEVLAALNVDKAVTIILSALVVKYANAVVFARKAAWQSPS